MALKQSFLAVPAKSTYDLDIASRVNSYIKTCLNLAPEVEQSVKEGLDELNRQRRNAFLHDECGKTVSSIETMQKYYDNFASLADKVQITDGECPIPFRWKSAFGEKGLFAGKRDLTLSYSGYEKSSVLFNIAAYMSKYAGNLELSNDENLRCAVRYFTSAANIFDLLKNDIMSFISDELPKDVQPQLLNALAQLMITQANEVMYVKALKDGNSPAILRCIAMQLSDNYETVHKLLSYEQARGIVDKSWYAVIQAKQYAFEAYGNKHQFDNLESGGLDAIEERLGRAREVLELFEKADQIYPHAYDGELKSAKVTWEKTEKDNNLIYHVRIPKKNDLPAIPRKLVLNVGTVKFPLYKEFKDMFVQLVSVHVNKAVNIFQNQLKERVFGLVSDLRSSNANIKSGLAAINMPALIEDELKQDRIPESINAKADDIRSKGGFHAIEVQEKTLADASNETNGMITNIRKTLEAEERSDTALRSYFSARWTTHPSSQLVDKFRQEIGKYSGIIRTAMEADEKVKGKIRLCERDVQTMSGPRDSLVERIPPITSSAANKSQAVERLRELWGVMSGEMNKVDNLEKRLNEIKYDPTPEFLEMYKRDKNLDDAKAAEFAGPKISSLIDPIAKEVNDNKNMCANLLEEMRVWYQNFNAGSHGDENRTKALQQLAAAYDAYLECQSNLKEGTKFYNDLKGLLIRLQQQIDDYCFARQTEKEDLVAVLEPGKNATEFIKSLTDKLPQPASSIPPPRPPPPSASIPPASSSTNRLPEINQLNINQAPSVPPRSDAPTAPPSIPHHQQHQGYQPNTAQNNWYQQPQQQPYAGYQQPQQYSGYQQPPQQQYPGYQQPSYQQMPQHLPFYGAMQQQPNQQQNYNMPYPTQYQSYPQPPQYQQNPAQYGQQNPPQYAPQQNPPNSNSNNPFAQ